MRDPYDELAQLVGQLLAQRWLKERSIRAVDGPAANSTEGGQPPTSQTIQKRPSGRRDVGRDNTSTGHAAM